MGIYTDGKPRFLLIEMIINFFKNHKKRKNEESDWEQKLKDGYGKGLK